MPGAARASAAGRSTIWSGSAGSTSGSGSRTASGSISARSSASGRARVAISHCPTSNMILASGCCPVPDLERAGAPVGLGVDGSASNDASNLIEEVRHAFLLQRLHHGADQISHRDALRWATEGSAACLGRPDLGRIAPGMQADLALFRLDELRFSGAGDPLAALILCGASRADRVMVQGRWLVEDGQIPGLDLDRLRAAHGAAARALQS